MNFGVRKIYESRVADLKEAHEREVAALKISISQLVEQIEYLRMTGIPAPLRSATPIGALQHREPMATPPYMSEEEEDVRHMAASGLLDEQALVSALADLGIER